MYQSHKSRLELSLSLAIHWGRSFVSSLVGMSVAHAYLSGPLPRVFAHRGFHENAPENSLSAFREALALGATHLETDVRVTSDDVPVLFHDPRVLVAGQSLNVSNLSLHELQRECAVLEIPTLAHALEVFPTARFNIDIKDERAIPAVVNVISTARAWDRVLLASFQEKTRRRILAAHPHAITSASRRIVVLSALFATLRLTSVFRRALGGVVALQIPERIGLVPLATARLVDSCHAAGVEVHVWTVNEVRDIERLLARGVDGIISDRCDRVVIVARSLPE